MEKRAWTWNDGAKVPDYDLRDVAHEFATHVEAGCAVLTEAFARLSATVEAAETTALIDAVEQQIEAWEDSV